MGSVVPFPVRRTQGETKGVRALPAVPCEVVILQVVQLVRPAVPVGSAAEKV